MKKNAKPSSSAQKTKPLSPELQRLEDVFKVMTAYGVNELELEDKSGRMHVRMQGSAYVSYAGSPTAHVAPPTTIVNREASVSASKPVASKDAPLASNQKKLLSPFVGTFFRASNPNAAPYVKEGQAIRKGQTICIIEAMKLMNEIESDFDGKIVSALVENGQPVEFGEPLFIIEI